MLDPRYMTAALKVEMTLETIGLLVHRRIAPFELVLELTGGLVQVLWRTLERHVHAVREEQAQPAYAEWFEWLVIMAARHKSKAEPACVRAIEWEP